MNIEELIEIRQDIWHWPKDDVSCWNYMMSHPDLPKKISNLVSKKRVCVQAGGNMGYYVKQYATLFEHVYTFEPDFTNFYCLNLNVPESNVTKIQTCIGYDRENVKLKIKSLNRGKNHIIGKGVIPTLQIDDLNLPECDLIHLDIEGYELFALRGAEQTIERCKPIIAIEYFEKCCVRYNYSLADLEQFFSQLNYKFAINFKEERVYVPII